MRILTRFAAPFLLILLAGSWVQSAPAQTAAVAQQSILLPTPQTTGGRALREALAERKTTRAFADRPLAMQQLSDLLWAGFGVNRRQGPAGKPGRTAPSAHNGQEIDLYVVLAQGAYRYDAIANRLLPVAGGDRRAQIGSGAAAHAAVTLVFVAPAANAAFAEVDTGFIGQNIYLYAAAEGLNAWFYTLRHPEVAAALRLGSGQKPLYGQSVGFPEP